MCEEITVLHVYFLHLTNASNYLKDGQWYSLCPFVIRTLNVLLALNVHVLRDTNFMFVVTPPFVFLTGQPQKKNVCPNTEKIQIKMLLL